VYISPDKEVDMLIAIDRGDSIGAMEPLSISESSPRRAPLADLALELVAKSEGFRRSLPPAMVSGLADLVRSMNCYYSNLIEGHDTHPIDIERALAEDFSKSPEKRNLQLEARAHIHVQRWLDEGGLSGGRAMTAAGIAQIHHWFYAEMPDDLMWVDDPQSGERVRVEGGEWRNQDVQIGRLIAISPGAIPRFLERFEAHYTKQGKLETVISAAACHHRLAWIHPFLDGNGRVMRLMSHAVMLDSVGSGGLWSVARGLARNAERYKALLGACDMPRRNDLDGRGTLSEEALIDFTRFFLQVCLDQVQFMESLMKPEELQTRVRVWVEEEVRLRRLPVGSGLVLDALLYRGELLRSELPALLGVAERQAGRVTAALIASGAVTSHDNRAPLRLAFPAHLAGRWMPGLFPDA
jgi:Fic family protein